MRVHLWTQHIVRLAGFRLIEAGLEPKPSVESSSFSSFPYFGRLLTCPVEALIHVLQLASKASASLSGKSLSMNFARYKLKWLYSFRYVV
jgi:hypothetical protein